MPRSDCLPYHPYSALRRSSRFHTIAPELREIQSKTFLTRRHMFADPLERQTSCKDLLFYDRDREKLVSFPYPMHNGQLIFPSGLKKYCESRCMMWECWCGMYTSTPVFIQFHTKSKMIWAHCRTCGLDVCFNEKYHSSTIHISYQGYPKECRQIPMPSISPPIRRDMDMPEYEPEDYRLRTPSPLPRLLVSLSPPSASSLLRRFQSASQRTSANSSSGARSSSSSAGPSRFQGAFEENSEDVSEDVNEICRRCEGAYSIRTFDTHVCIPKGRHARS
ncbi:hypothetical protein M422DRAFT_267533 [Sphaerobolus stellatus SS14]|uniref:Uncharacterized protein n=1 Tax=Sphaerobolus stellatus (strain SS14) TaxID=990650 RepID=A0A0C9UZZ4_SPHS4|nr:hypothetical protein M422DRAFT_267533 [Sphaerobolus stellatus SS14]